MSTYGHTRLWWDTPEPLPPAASFRLTKELFVEAERQWPDIMEPWSNRVGESDNLLDQQKIMRAALAATLKQRWPEKPAPDLRKNIA